MQDWPRKNKHPADGPPPHKASRGRLRSNLELHRGESGSIEIARRQILSITDRFLLLANHPEVGRARDADLGSGRRSYPVDRYVIVYRIDGPDVLILRVAHGSRDIETLFGR